MVKNLKKRARIVEAGDGRVKVMNICKKGEEIMRCMDVRACIYKSDE